MKAFGGDQNAQLGLVDIMGSVTTDYEAHPFADSLLNQFMVVFYWIDIRDPDIGPLLSIRDYAENDGWPVAGIESQHAGGSYTTIYTKSEWMTGHSLTLREVVNLVLSRYGYFDKKVDLKTQIMHNSHKLVRICGYLHRSKHFPLTTKTARMLLALADFKAEYRYVDKDDIPSAPQAEEAFTVLRKFLVHSGLASYPWKRLRKKTKTVPLYRRVRQYNERMKIH